MTRSRTASPIWLGIGVLLSLVFGPVSQCVMAQGKEPVPPGESGLSTNGQRRSADPLGFPELRGKIKEGYLRHPDGSTDLIVYQLVDGIPIFEGDIVLSFDEFGMLTLAKNLAEKSAGRALRSVLWPNKTVYYRIDPTLPNQSRVTNAIAEWETYTSLDFVLRTTQSNYVTFRPGSGCSSSVGMQGGQQYITIESACSVGNVIHEIGHAVGLFHEQTRNDRDTYIIINWQNIEPGKEHNFQRYYDQDRDGQDYGPYDYNSIMHYPAYAFSMNDQPTITRRSGTGGMGNSVLSTGDRNGVEFLYGSTGRLLFYEGNFGTQDLVCQTVAGTMNLNFTKISDCSNDEARSLELLDIPPGYILRIHDSPSCSTSDDWTEIRTWQAVSQYVVHSFESSFGNSSLQVTHHHVNGLDGKVSCVKGARCGDGQCSSLESCSTCPGDCGACPPVCGDGLCHAGETCGSCPRDCGTCFGGAVCGNFVCENGETCETSGGPGECQEDCSCCAGWAPVCFAAGTPVTLADGSTKPIEQVAVGDLVLAYEEHSGKVIQARVSKTFVHKDVHETLLAVNGHLLATADHPFYVKGRSEPVRAKDLRVGDELLVLDGAPDRSEPGLRAIKVDSLQQRPPASMVYNIEVAGPHNYFAGGVLVHNKTAIAGCQSSGGTPIN